MLYNYYTSYDVDFEPEYVQDIDGFDIAEEVFCEMRAWNISLACQIDKENGDEPEPFLF